MAGRRLTKAPEAVQGFTGLEPLPGAAPPRPPQARTTAVPAPDGAPLVAPGTRAERARRERAEAAQAQHAEALAEAERLDAEQTAAQEAADSAAAALAVAEEEARAATFVLWFAKKAVAFPITSIVCSISRTLRRSRTSSSRSAVVNAPAGP